VFVFGGSTTFGYGLADTETIPTHLEAILGADFAVYNFGNPNYTAVQERIRLEQLFLDGHVPRVAVFIDGFDEFIAPFYAPVMFKPFVDALEPRPRRWFGRHSETQPVECRLPDPKLVIDRYVTNMRLIRGVCREFRVRPLFVWQPVPCYRYQGAVMSHGSDDGLIECVRTGYALMDARRWELAADDFLWLGDLQEGRTEPLYVDADHYTAGFSREVASRIAERLS
jgi:hypothetical protein